MAEKTGGSGLGGARPGAGRPRKADVYRIPIRRAEKRIADSMPFILNRMLELAEGVTVQERIHGEEVIYRRPPDRAACEYLLNRIMGRPVEKSKVEVSGPAGGPIPIREVIVRRPEPDAEPVGD